MHEKKCITFLIKITHINLLKKCMIHKHIHIFLYLYCINKQKTFFNVCICIYFSNKDRQTYR